jgi:DNA-binding NarL/FixJ family response regulator
MATTTVAEAEAAWSLGAAMADVREATKAVEEATARQYEAILRAAAAGASSRTIAEATGWHFTTVAKYVREAV